MSPKQLEILNDIIRSAESEIAEKVGVGVRLRVMRSEQRETFVIEMIDLFRRICKVWGVEMDYLKSKSRKQDQCMMRQVLWLAAKENYPMVHLIERSRILGRSDHSTVLQQINRAEGLLKVNDDRFMGYFEPVKHLIYA